MNKSRVIQFSLAALAIILFFFTYYSGKNNKEEAVLIDKNSSKENISNLTEKISNVIEEVSYSSSDNRGTIFKLNADIAEVFYDTPNINNMKTVDALISLKDGRKIYIKSDYAIYNKSTHNTNFMENILVTESNNKITSDNLDLIMSDNLPACISNLSL